jgi:hypothetical protein
VTGERIVKVRDNGIGLILGKPIQIDVLKYALQKLFG